MNFIDKIKENLHLKKQPKALTTMDKVENTIQEQMEQGKSLKEIHQSKIVMEKMTNKLENLEEPEERQEVLENVGSGMVESNLIPYNTIEKVLNQMLDSDNYTNSDFQIILHQLPKEDQLKYINNNYDAMGAELIEKTVAKEAISPEEVNKEAQSAIYSVEKDKEMSYYQGLYSKINGSRTDQEVMNLLGKYKSDDKEIKSKKMDIVAKKIAFNYAKYGMNILSHFTDTVPATELAINNIPDRVENEYNKLKVKFPSKSPKFKEYHKEELKFAILEKIKNDKKISKETKKQIDNTIQDLRIKLEKDQLVKIVDTFSSFTTKAKPNEIEQLGNFVKLINKIPDDKRKDVLKTVNESIESRVKENDSKIKDDKLEYNNKNVLNIDNVKKSNKDDIDK